MLKEILEILKKPQTPFDYVILVCIFVSICSLVILGAYTVILFVYKMFPVVSDFFNLIFGT